MSSSSAKTRTRTLTPEQQLLVEQNLPLVTIVLKRYASNHCSSIITWQDLFQVGCIGLIHAAAVYDPATGYRFSTLAVKCITMQLFQFFRDCNRQSRKPPLPPVSMDAAFTFHNGDQSTLSRLLPDSKTSVPTSVLYRRALHAMSHIASESPSNQVLVDLLLGNLTQQQAAHLCGCSQAQISRRFTRLRHRIISEISMPALEGNNENHYSVL